MIGCVAVACLLVCVADGVWFACVLGCVLVCLSGRPCVCWVGFCCCVCLFVWLFALMYEHGCLTVAGAFR